MCHVADNEKHLWNRHTVTFIYTFSVTCQGVDRHRTQGAVRDPTVDYAENITQYYSHGDIFQTSGKCLGPTYYQK